MRTHLCLGILLLITICLERSSGTQLLSVGALSTSTLANVLFSIDTDKNTIAPIAVFTNSSGASLSGQLTFNAANAVQPPPSPYSDSFFALLWQATDPIGNCALWQYETTTNTTKALLYLKGCQPYGMVWDPTNVEGGALWGVVYQSTPDAFCLGYYSLAQGEWVPFITLEIPTVDFAFMSAAIDAEEGNFYVFYVNTTDGYNWLATIPVTGENKGQASYNRFPDNPSEEKNPSSMEQGVIVAKDDNNEKLKRSMARNQITAPVTHTARQRHYTIIQEGSPKLRSDPNLEYIESVFSVKTKTLYALGLNTSVSQLTFFLGTIDPVTLQLTPTVTCETSLNQQTLDPSFSQKFEKYFRAEIRFRQAKHSSGCVRSPMR